MIGPATEGEGWRGGLAWRPMSEATVDTLGVVSPGGAAGAVDVQSGGALILILILLPGGTAVGTTLESGGLLVSSGVVFFSGLQVLSTAGNAPGIALSAGETALAYSGAMIMSADFGSRGVELLAQGRVASATGT